MKFALRNPAVFLVFIFLIICSCRQESLETPEQRRRLEVDQSAKQLSVELQIAGIEGAFSNSTELVSWLEFFIATNRLGSELRSSCSAVWLSQNIDLWRPS